jgi:hypothetical protein
MGEKQWLQDFESGLDRLRICFVVEQGKVTKIIVVQYEAYIEGQWRAIVRFDEAHGYFHRDIISPSGEQEKTAQPTSDKGVALTDAINHVKQFWRTYRQAYEDEEYERK